MSNTIEQLPAVKVNNANLGHIVAKQENSRFSSELQRSTYQRKHYNGYKPTEAC
jgi:hypothetical protein